MKRSLEGSLEVRPALPHMISMPVMMKFCSGSITSIEHQGRYDGVGSESSPKGLAYKTY